MHSFVRNGKTYWGGIHQQLGLLIYDPCRQRRLATDKVRLYIVEERRLALFQADLVRRFLVSSDTWFCPRHESVMKQRRDADGTWWSHQQADGTWCTG